MMAQPVRPYPIHILQELLNQNKSWATRVEQRDPGFFRRSAESQHPKVSHARASRG